MSRAFLAPFGERGLIAQSFTNYQLNKGSITEPVVLLDFDTYVALTYHLADSLCAMSLQNSLKDQYLAVPFSDVVAELLDIYYNPEKEFLVDPVKYAQHEKLILDSWLAEDWVYEEMLDKSARRSQ